MLHNKRKVFIQKLFTETTMTEEEVPDATLEEEQTSAADQGTFCI